MFAPYCPIHGSRVLLFAENLIAIESTPRGWTLRFRCDCGYTGTCEVNRREMIAA
ncbi:MAG: hypothetical protein L0Z63_04880 [Actinobacteria bacterium]|nr:hypothetical protein [Actinomycetota bacterium]